jgi:hypothetical protein
MTSLQKPISANTNARPIVFKQSAAPNPLLALLGDEDDGDDEISAFGRARVVNLDDTRVRIVDRDLNCNCAEICVFSFAFVV